MLSGITTLNTPPKNPHAASNPEITVSRSWRNDNHTNVWRDTAAVNTNAHTFRRLPDSSSNITPSSPKSTCNSAPGSPSATGTVDRGGGPNSTPRNG